MRASISKLLGTWPGSGKQPGAVILGASVGALSFVRSLGRRGIPTLLLDGAREVGLTSRFGLTVALPPVAEKPEAWLELLGEIGERAPTRPVMFVASDEQALFVSAHLEQLETRYALLQSPSRLLADLVDKRRQHALAGRAGIPLPRCAWPRNERELADTTDDFEFPCALKPAMSHLGAPVLGAKLLVAHDRSELLELFARWRARGVELMVQELIPGGDDSIYAHVSLRARDGREIAAITKQKLRQNPPAFGVGSVQMTIDEPEVAELARRLFSSLSYVGYSGVEFKHDARDGAFKLMEINPRILASNQLAVAAGVDLPFIGYCCLTGAPPPPSAQRDGVVMVHEDWDLKSLLRSQPGRIEAVRSWCHPSAMRTPTRSAPGTIPVPSSSPSPGCSPGRPDAQSGVGEALTSPGFSDAPHRRGRAAQQ